MTSLQDYVRYVCARQAATDRRQRGEPWPWSDDPTIRSYTFCSAIRDDDRTSREARQLILDLPEPLRLGAALTFRLYNRIDTLAALRDAGALEARSSEPIKAVFGTLSAVISTAFKLNVGGQLNDKNAIARGVYLGLRAARNGDFVRRRSAQITTQAIKGTLGVGPFVAYQIMQDLRWLFGSYDDEMLWCVMGPGAVRGARRIANTYEVGAFGEGKTKYKKHDDLRIDGEFRHLLLAALDALRESDLSSRERINMFEVEHNLCELDKYERTRTGEWKGRPFRPREKGAAP
jgi:alpha-glutamyl/putrescinyl thymine pyrophosphorylase clade 1